ncbi:MAG: hypothetical protein HQK55_13665 [Deltaproteobacteria bacterium]|nr:hypothetical protein [Deltaproteobacteria bacterium]
MLKKMRLKLKLAFSFGATLLFLGMVIAIYHYSLTYSASTFIRLLTTENLISRGADEIYSQMLECRRSEKDFLIRKNLEYLSTVETHYKNIKKAKSFEEKIIT